MRGTGLLAGVVALGVAGSAHGALINLINENFDSMGPAGTAPPAGWITGNLSPERNNNSANPYTAVPNGTVIAVGTLTVDDGNNGDKGRSFNNGVPGGADRSLGMAATGTASNGNAMGDRAIQVEVTNTTGQVLTTVNVSYTGKTWRTWDSPVDQDKLFLLVSSTAAAPWTATGYDYTPTAGASATPANGDANAVNNIGGVITGLNVAPGGKFYLTWFEPNTISNDATKAIDNVLITADGTVPEPATLGLAGVAAATLLGRRRRPR